MNKAKNDLKKVSIETFDLINTIWNIILTCMAIYFICKALYSTDIFTLLHTAVKGLALLIISRD
jgi:hypothetical protein